MGGLGALDGTGHIGRLSGLGGLGGVSHIHVHTLIHNHIRLTSYVEEWGEETVVKDNGRGKGLLLPPPLAPT